MTSGTIPPFCAAADWGTSSFRLWLLDADGAVTGERRSREGMLAAAEPGFAAVLDGHLAALGAPGDLPVIVCGMAGARQGWIEAPYVEAPADMAAIATGAVRVPGLARDVRILPGVAQRGVGGTAHGPDVIRGEETQIMGLPADMKGLVCLPGTHSKWVQAAGGRIAAFTTFMTGELFALLSQHSILSHSVQAGVDILDFRDAFLGGVEASLDAPALVTNQLFSLRAAGLFGALSPDETTARLSGLLIGLELAGAKAAYPGDTTVVLIASGPLLALYREALSIADYSFREGDAETAVRSGLFSAARHCFSQGYPA